MTTQVKINSKDSPAATSEGRVLDVKNLRVSYQTSGGKYVLSTM
ncbi:MAG: hypothetical protein R2873_23765 [Caldilineaceae bacterium]